MIDKRWLEKKIVKESKWRYSTFNKVGNNCDNNFKKIYKNKLFVSLYHIKGDLKITFTFHNAEEN